MLLQLSKTLVLRPVFCNESHTNNNSTNKAVVHVDDVSAKQRRVRLRMSRSPIKVEKYKKGNQDLQNGV